MRTYFAFVLVAGFLFPTSCNAQAVQNRSQVAGGTIDVVISTPEGFALASDSRLTYADRHHSDDAQKIFPIGTRTAVIVAGLYSGVYSGKNVRPLYDAVSDSMLAIDNAWHTRYVEARVARGAFFGSVSRVAGLVDPDSGPLPSIVAETSVVSFTDDGKPQWISNTLQFAPERDMFGGDY